jgi:parallel beta-helix repeat protein
MSSASHKLSSIAGCALFAVAALIAMMVASDSVDAVQSAFTPVADTYVNEASPGSNYGSNSTLRVDGSPIVNSYLRFNVQGLSGGISSATLRVFANSSQSVGFQVHDVANDTWAESGITFSSAPPISAAVLDSTGPVTAGQTYDLDVTAMVAGNGLVSFGLMTTHTTALSLASRESANAPQLIVEAGAASTPPPTTATPVPTAAPTPTPGATPPPPTGRLTVVTRSGSTYTADALWSGGHDYSGSRVKTVVENAMNDMDNAGGGTIQFEAGIFDLGTDYFYIRSVANITFAGRGMDVTFIRNNTSASADTEPFNTGQTHHLIIRDMTVSAGGARRTTSDALDFDGGNYNIVERVKVTASRGRAIVFDGKGSGGEEANNNIIRDCIVTGVQHHGIQLLAADNNRIENCTVINAQGHGIQVTKSSNQASTPNEKSNDNIVIGNTISDSLQDGINVNSSDRNRILNNNITLSGNNGIKLTSSDNIQCNDNVVDGNTSANNTQWGLYISSSLCNRTNVGTNTFSGNGSGAFRDSGTNTQ